MGVLLPGTSHHRSLPVRCMNNYLLYVNHNIKKYCTEDALKLCNTKFIEVMTSKILHQHDEVIKNKFSEDVKVVLHAKPMLQAVPDKTQLLSSDGGKMLHAQINSFTKGYYTRRAEKACVLTTLNCNNSKVKLQDTIGNCGL